MAKINQISTTILTFMFLITLSSCDNGRAGFYEVTIPTDNMTCEGIYIYDDDTWETQGTDMIPLSGGQRYNYHYTGYVDGKGQLWITGGENTDIETPGLGITDVTGHTFAEFDGSKELRGSGMRFKKTNKKVQKKSLLE